MCIRARLGALEHHSAARPADPVGADPDPVPEPTLNLLAHLREDVDSLILIVSGVVIYFLVEWANRIFA